MFFFAGEENKTEMTLTEILTNETNQVTTVVVFVIAAVVVIILIFVLAVFIDCRQQKIEDFKAKSLRKRMRRKIERAFPVLPSIGETSQMGDEQTIVNHMEQQATSSHADVV
ncbi:hypothetical protein HUJ05_008597 [Dendroctonus ponderosae]|nr:hypothetical protein HUJ05_008591 [Dendroctonus ponderosae]KAH0998499.1 hypothetical protein HUJ05_008597 [Dendroctonus ponderosae]